MNIVRKGNFIIVIFIIYGASTKITKWQFYDIRYSELSCEVSELVDINEISEMFLEK